jgi:hypothetical protein
VDERKGIDWASVAIAGLVYLALWGLGLIEVTP